MKYKKYNIIIAIGFGVQKTSYSFCYGISYSNNNINSCILVRLLTIVLEKQFINMH